MERDLMKVYPIIFLEKNLQVIFLSIDNDVYDQIFTHY
jgi:hypothetical protein